MRAIAGLLLAFLLGACRSDPPIGSNLPSNYEEGERVFDGRVKRQFPIGMSEERLVRELEAQGFTRLPRYDEIEDATFKRSEFLFETIWSVRWRASNGRVDEIWGVYGVRAP